MTLFKRKSDHATHDRAHLAVRKQFKPKTVYLFQRSDTHDHCPSAPFWREHYRRHRLKEPITSVIPGGPDKFNVAVHLRRFDVYSPVQSKMVRVHHDDFFVKVSTDVTATATATTNAITTAVFRGTELQYRVVVQHVSAESHHRVVVQSCGIESQYRVTVQSHGTASEYRVVAKSRRAQLRYSCGMESQSVSIISHGVADFRFMVGGGVTGAPPKTRGGVLWKRAPVTRTIISILPRALEGKFFNNGLRKRVMHACPPHVAGMMQCMLLTRVYALSNKYAVTLVTYVALVLGLMEPILVLQPSLVSRVDLPGLASNSKQQHQQAASTREMGKN